MVALLHISNPVNKEKLTHNRTRAVELPGKLFLFWAIEVDEISAEVFLHSCGVGDLDRGSARIRGKRGVGSLREQKSDDLNVVILYGIVNRSGRKNGQRFNKSSSFSTIK